MELLLLVPVALLVLTIVCAVKMVTKGVAPRKAFVRQVLSFVAICVISFSVPMVISATADEPAAEETSTSQTATDDSSKGLSLIAVALSTGLAGIGGGIAVASAAPAAIGATSEDPKAFGKALIFVALGEGIALYGLLISILIINKV